MTYNKMPRGKAFLIAIGILTLAGTAMKACDPEECRKCGSELEISMKLNDKHLCRRCYDIDKMESDRYWQRVREHYKNNSR